ncbi:MAG TPA: DEAD/DEAH box helicase [Solirubrobacterales bacterium]|nr:DEAD/DEAH box helicase [Solirubrobacterales bacterium]
MEQGWTEALSGLLAGEDERLVTRVHEPGQPAVTAPIPDDLHPQVREALIGRGITSLYSHQADAWETVMRRGHTIVTTGTASGKSLCFNLPVLHVLATDPRARALYLYPTKALAQDQARSLTELSIPSLHHAIYDGDTPQEERPAIRKRANVVLTNPDMLHVGILPHHAAWGDFLANLALVVVDEAHVYRGVFGSHVANVLRRLRRLAEAYGTTPRFVLTSATIANPLALAQELTGLEFDLVDRDGSERGQREVVMCNPPLIDERTMRRASSLGEAATLFADLVGEEVRTICFARSRRAAELIYQFARKRLEESSDLAGRITPYRAGYTPRQRREIERSLASGDLLGVVTTNALELGIDIGHLDAAISVTFPGTVASLRQQWGRAGRTERGGLAMYVAGDDALDQFFCRHPDEFLERPVEAAILDHGSEMIYMNHLCVAAYEGPLEPGDEETLGPGMIAAADRLVAAGRLRKRAGRYHPRDWKFPAAKLSLRSASPDSFTIVEAEAGEIIGFVEAERAFSTVHPGAVYLHLGEPYEVEELDIDGRRALVHPAEGNYYTQPKIETETFIEETREERDALGVPLRFGIVSVMQEVVAFQRKRMADHEVIDLQTLDLPEQNFVTQALWYELPDMADSQPLQAMLGALHAAEHSQIAVLPLIAMCDRWDIGGLSTNIHHQTGCPTIFIYDGHPGGVGITRRGFDEFERLVGDARRLLDECPCEAGCPSCVQSPKCGNLNEPLSKHGALDLMGRMLTAGRAAVA